MGFGTHPHNNMEIISIPLEGDLEHKDNMGNVSVIRRGDVQVMSAGTGIMHSEYNKNKDKPAKFLQIWVIPDKRNVTPRYDQITLDNSELHNTLKQILSPSPDDDGVWIHQQSWFYLGQFDKDFTFSYNLKRKENGVYVFVLKGGVKVNEATLAKRDRLGIWETEKISFVSLSQDMEILLMGGP